MRGPLRSEVQRASRLWKKAMPPLKQEEEEFLLELAERVREVRAESGITQEKFYEDTNIHIARIEAGKSNISINTRSEEHTAELQSLMRNSYAVFCLKKITEMCNTSSDNLLAN